MDNNVLIYNHDEKLCLSSKYSIFISRRSLKHFVERRKSELIIRYNIMDIINRLFLIIDSVEDVYLHHDSIETNELQRFIYTKNYNHLDRSSVRIVLENKEDRLEIVSMHFKKTKTTRR